MADENGCEGSDGSDIVASAERAGGEELLTAAAGRADGGAKVRALAAQLVELSSALVAAHETELAELRGRVHAAEVDPEAQLAAGDEGAPSAPVVPEAPVSPVAPMDLACPEDMRLLVSEATDECAQPVQTEPMAFVVGTKSTTSRSRSRRIRVEILSASGLRNADWMLGSGLSDPYCTCRILGKDEQPAIKTPTVNNSLSPVWNSAGVFSNFELGDVLQFSVFDEDIGKSDDFLGDATLGAESVLPGGFEGTLTLENDGTEGSYGTRTPELRVRISVEDDDRQFVEGLRNKSALIWSRMVEHGSASEMNIEQSLKLGALIADKERRIDSLRMRQQLSRLQRLVVPPASKKRVLWDCIALLTVAYDAFTIPFVSAFDVEMGEEMFYVSLAVASFWTCDVVFTFFTGIYRQGVMVMSFREIAKQYLRTWFWLDIVIAGVNWLYVMSWFMEQQGEASQGNLLRVLKSARGLRALRLLSLAHSSRALSSFDSMVHGSHRDLVDSIVRLGESLLVLLGATHFIACGWYYLGTRTSASGINWVDYRDVSDRDIAYRYASSFHWALCQFTPAGMEIHPTNAAERAYTVFIDLCGLVAFSTFVSTITTRMTHLRSLKKEQTAQIKMLRKFFHENSVSLDVREKVLSFLRSNKQSVKSRTSSQGITLLKDLPVHLRTELDQEIFLPILKQHPVLQHLALLEPACANDMCVAAITEHALVKKERLFTEGDLAERMYFVISGQVSYRRAGAESSCYKGDWLSEAALWMDGWLHRGRCHAVNRSDVVGLNSKAFHRILEDSLGGEGRAAHLAYRYALQFVADKGPPHADDMLRCTDVWGDYDHMHRVLSKAVDHENHHFMRVPTWMSVGENGRQLMSFMRGFWHK